MISFMLPRTRACIVTDDEWARNPDSGIPKLLSECRPESCHTAPPKEPERKCRGCGEYHPARLFYTVDTEGVSHRANFCPECRQQRYRRLAELAHKKANPAEPKPKPEPKERAPRTGRRVDYTQPRPCRCCGRVLPPEAYFYSDKAAGTRKAQCKECTNKKDAERRARQAQSTNQPPHPAPLAQGQPPPRPMRFLDMYDSAPPEGADLLLMVADDAGTRHYCLAMREGDMIVYLDREGQPGAFRIPDAGADHIYYLILDNIDIPQD